MQPVVLLRVDLVPFVQQLFHDNPGRSDYLSGMDSVQPVRRTILHRLQTGIYITGHPPLRNSHDMDIRGHRNIAGERRPCVDGIRTSGRTRTARFGTLGPDLHSRCELFNPSSYLQVLSFGRRFDPLHRLRACAAVCIEERRAVIWPDESCPYPRKIDGPRTEGTPSKIEQNPLGALPKLRLTTLDSPGITATVSNAGGCERWLRASTRMPISV